MSSILYVHEIPDKEKYLELFETTDWNTSYQASSYELNKAIQNSWYVIAAYENHELIGFGRIVSDGVLYAMIYDLIVKPAFQSQGVGTCILEQLIEKCKKVNMRCIQLFSAQGKIDFYQKRGFIQRSDDAPGMSFIFSK